MGKITLIILAFCGFTLLGFWVGLHYTKIPEPEVITETVIVEVEDTEKAEFFQALAEEYWQDREDAMQLLLERENKIRELQFIIAIYKSMGAPDIEVDVEYNPTIIIIPKEEEVY